MGSCSSTSMVKDVPSTSDTSKQEIVQCYLFPGSGTSISISQYSTKLAMYCRLAAIPHSVNHADINKAPNHKVPYISHGKLTIGDSQLIIRYLEQKYDIPMLAKNAGTRFVPFSALTKENQARSEMIRAACEGDLYWAINCTRILGKMGPSKSEDSWQATVEVYFSEIPSLIRTPVTNSIRNSMVQAAWGQGFARHSPDDQIYIAQRQIDAMETMLEGRDFYLGDFPSECDCIAFGTLQNLLDDVKWPNPLSTYTRSNCPNIVAYVERVQQQVFSDFAPGDVLPKGSQ